MKFEDYLMEKSQEPHNRQDLEKEVVQLQAQLKGEEALNRVLLCALHGPVCSLPLIPSVFPPQVHELLEELAVVEEEIILLERKVKELKLRLYQERDQTIDWEIDHKRQPKLYNPFRGSFGYESMITKQRASLDREESETVPRLTLSCMKSTGFMSKTSFNCKTPSFLSNGNASSCLDPYGISSDLDCTARDIGPYKDFIQITRSSLDIECFSQYLPAFRKLRVLMHKLCDVDLSFLTYKQKLAFWINIYNACIMNAFLDHGLPSTQDKLLSLMNKAAMNVGGIVLNALAIEHFILRHPCESKHGPVDEKEVLLRHAYGLGYPEPNVTFALCRGTWSSPALRVYTSEEVVNQLGKAKAEYLEASVGITNKRKIIMPKLLQWHMHDFADEMESLVEWIYSQLPRSGSLKRAMMECLLRETKYPMSKMVEIQPYESEFRYILPM
ncbi:Ternary complex factor MIP1, leucine-zipper [Sesbania bispinosa]|nr:Ternary complex factor MIP1, leucine-zipper [Sesbania bispinosa]